MKAMLPGDFPGRSACDAVDDWGLSVNDCPHCFVLSQELELAKAERVVAAIWASREADAPQPFGLYRHKDVTGASGTGLVATGVKFSDGTVVIRWRGDNPSTVVWPSIEAAEKIHGHGGLTRIVWLTERIEDLCAAVERDFQEGRLPKPE